MIPTDAARLIVDTDHDHPAIARALLDATERISALEGALRQIRELTEDYEHDSRLSEVWYVANDALTPEGELNGN